jgi:hypothetical protein
LVGIIQKPEKLTGCVTSYLTCFTNLKMTIEFSNSTVKPSIRNELFNIFKYKAIPSYFRDT